MTDPACCQWPMLGQAPTPHSEHERAFRNTVAAMTQEAFCKSALRARSLSTIAGIYAGRDNCIEVDHRHSCRFFITVCPTPHLNGKHVVFGQVLKVRQQTRARSAQ